MRTVSRTATTLSSVGSEPGGTVSPPKRSAPVQAKTMRENGLPKRP